VVISLPEYFPNNKRIEAQVSEYIELKDYESAIKLIKMINYPSAHLEVHLPHEIGALRLDGQQQTSLQSCQLHEVAWN
jgi:hypothetical protein